MKAHEVLDSLSGAPFRRRLRAARDRLRDASPTRASSPRSPRTSTTGATRSSTRCSSTASPTATQQRLQVRPGYLARFQGGDWRGLDDHLDYLEALGVTTLWISPVVKNVETDADVDGYHGYWAQDLTQPNPHFGDVAAAAQAHGGARTTSGIKVVLDIVTNHMGQLFYYDMNLNGNPDIYIGGSGALHGVSGSRRPVVASPSTTPTGTRAASRRSRRSATRAARRSSSSRIRDQPRAAARASSARARAYHGFGRILNYDDEKQRMLGDFPGGLKDVATELPEVRAEMIDAYTRWAELVDLDGFRIDTVKHVEHEFWQEFATEGPRAPRAAGQEQLPHVRRGVRRQRRAARQLHAEGMLDSVFYFSQHFQVFRDVFKHAHDDGAAEGHRADREALGGPRRELQQRAAAGRHRRRAEPRRS